MPGDIRIRKPKDVLVYSGNFLWHYIGAKENAQNSQPHRPEVGSQYRRFKHVWMMGVPWKTGKSQV